MEQNTAIQADESVRTIYSLLHENGMEQEKQNFTRMVTDFARMENHVDSLSQEVQAMHRELEQLKDKGIRPKVAKVVQAVQSQFQNVKTQFIFLKQTFISQVKSVIHNVKEAGVQALRKLSKVFRIRPALLHLKESVLQTDKKVVQCMIQVRVTRQELGAARAHFRNAVAAVTGKGQSRENRKADNGLLARLESRLERFSQKLKSVIERIDKALDRVERLEAREADYRKPVKADLQQIRQEQEQKERTQPQKQQKPAPRHYR